MYERKLIEFLLRGTGIKINGNNPWDPQIYNNNFFHCILKYGSLGLGESYMKGWWDCQHIDQFIERVLKNGMPWIATLNPIALSLFIKSKLKNTSPEKKAFDIGKVHYDLGNDLFESMLDPTMTYSCGYWKDASTLEEAQLAKFDLICRKIKLQPGQLVLDIGCGWGGLARYLTIHYGVKIVGLTVSKEQMILAQKRYKDFPIEIRLQDYRDIDEQFDHIISVGMFEHVCSKNYRIYMELVKRCLKPSGLFLLHTIGARGWFFHPMDPWIEKYIFPLGELPMRRQIQKSSKGLFEIRDWHEFGKYYDPTLMAWHSRFVSAWDSLEAKYRHLVNGQFRRMWQYYLLTCAGSFRAGNIELWQIVLVHPGEHQNYHIAR